jgi:hypothetical protein
VTLSASMSVIIPAYNEEHYLPETIDHLRVAEQCLNLPADAAVQVFVVSRRAAVIGRARGHVVCVHRGVEEWRTMTPFGGRARTRYDVTSSEAGGTFSLTSPAWQLLCGIASASSITPTVATQLLTSHNMEERVTRALACRAKLEALEVGLTTGQLQVPQATIEFMRCVEEAAFLDA